MRASEVKCARCPDLCASRTNIVDGVGPRRPTIMIIGEAPGANEDKNGVPFIGQAGKLLRATLVELGTSSDMVYFTNAVRCRPEDNRDPTDIEIENCSSWLQLEIEDIKPRIIIAVGRKAAQAISHSDIEVPVFEVYHPAYILRQRKKTDEWKGQLREALNTAYGVTPPIVLTPEPWEVGNPPADSRWLAIDTETDDLTEDVGVQMVTWQASDGEVSALYRPEQYHPDAPYEHVYYCNAKYDLPLFPGLNPRELSRWDDAQLMAYVLRYERVGLKELGPLLTGIEMAPINDILIGTREERRVLKSGPNKGKEKITVRRYRRSFSEALADDPVRAVRYAQLDAVVTSRMARVLEPQLKAIPKLWWYYQNIEKPLVPVLIDMERCGILVDTYALETLRATLRAQQMAADVVLASHGLDVNPDSNEQLADFLRRKGYALTELTNTGQVAVSKAALLGSVGALTKDDLNLEDERHRLISTILKRREYKKMQSTYVDALLDGRDSIGRVHPRFNQMVADTNRLSSSKPNAQNMPKHGVLKDAIRRVFIAKPGHQIVKADYSQLEVRIFAHYTQEPAIVGAYPWDGPARDVHQSIADELGIARPVAKNTLFASIYGAAPNKLAATAGIPIEEAGPFLARMRERIPSLLTWQERIANQLTRQGYIETLLGWRNYYPMFWSPIRRESQEAVRAAANMPIQGTAAGVVKILMAEVDKIAERWGARLLIQVHDEVVYEVPDAAVNGFSLQLSALGRRAGIDAGLTVPLDLEVEVGPNWADLTPLH